MNFINFGRFKAVRLFILTLIVPALLTSCGGGAESKTRNVNVNVAAQEQPPVATVTQVRAESRQVPSVIQATGSLVAEETSDIAPKVAGKIVNVSANVGQFVSQGAVIAKIDDQDARLRLAEARAGVVQAQAGVRQAEARLGLASGGRFTASAIPEVRAAGANIEQLQAELRQAEVNLRQAEVNERRYRELVETGDVAMITYEQYRTARDAARSARDTAAARLSSGRQQLEAALNTARQNNEAIRAAQANVEAARTQVGTAEQAVADTVVRAPFAGFISARPVAPGEYATSATPIATLVRTNPIKVQIQVAEADVPYIGLGRGVTIQVDAYKDRSFGGVVTAVNPSIDPTSRSAIIEAQIENNNNALRTGMFATVRITRDGGSLGVFVPKEAVLNDPATQSQRMFVIQEGVVKLRTVQIGPEESGMIQILNGVNADEMVATSNLPELYEGARVNVQ